jgi:hypothetical protein
MAAKTGKLGTTIEFILADFKPVAAHFTNTTDSVRPSFSGSAGRFLIPAIVEPRF